MSYQEQANTASDTSKMGAGAIASLIGIGALVVFMAQNRTSTPIKFLFWSFSWPVWLLILVSALLGALVWIGAGIMRRHRRRKERREDRRS